MKKFLIICLLFFFVSFYGTYLNFQQEGHFSNTNDYLFHYSMAKGECLEGVANYTLETCKNYPPLLSWISKPFSSNEITYQLFVLFILIILIPGIIFYSTKSVWSLLIYYSSSIVFNTIYASIFAQMMVFLIVALLLLKERFNPLIDLSLLLISPFVHNEAIYAVIPIILYKILKPKLEYFVFPAFVIFKEQTLTWSSLFKLGPIINWFYSLQLDNPKKILIFYFIVTGIIFDYRTILFIPLLWAYWLPEKIERYSNNKVYIICNLICYFAVIIIQFFLWFWEIWSL